MKALRILSVLFLAGAFLTACDDNPVDEDDDHDHAEVEGLVLIMNGATLVTVEDGEVSGHIHLAPGEESDLIRVEFMDGDGDEIHDEDLGDEFSLGHDIEDESIAEFEQHDEDGRWAFHIHAEAAGETDLTLMLMHNDHADFRTPAIEIHVE